MKGIKKLYFTVILLMISTLQMMAQQKITGRVIDDDGFAVPYASVQYKGHKIAVSSNGEGKFTIEKKPGLMLTVSALSYKSTSVKVDEKTKLSGNQTERRYAQTYRSGGEIEKRPLQA